MGKLDQREAKALNSRSSFFNLEDDGDFALVRLPYETLDEMFLDVYGCHEVKDPKFRLIDCLRASIKDPADACPLCMRLEETFEGEDDKTKKEASKSQEEGKIKAKYFLQLYNEELGCRQIWTRSETFLKDIKSAVEDIIKDKSLVSALLKVKRNGKKCDNKTTYDWSIVEEEKVVDGESYFKKHFDNTTLEDLPPALDVYETKQLMYMDYETMKEFLVTRKFPEKDDNKTEKKDSGANYKRRSSKDTSNNAAGF